MPLQFLKSPPENVCILRLSALGDVCHTLAVLRTLQAAWPTTRFTWLIGRIEHRLMSLVPEIEFITVDKRGGLAEYRRLRRLLTPRRFDLCLHMQVSLRASMISTLVRAPVKIGFDRERAREGQWLFTSERVRPAPRQHVLDGLFGFAEVLGVHDRLLAWQIPVPAAEEDYARRLIPDTRPTLLISPCSSHPARNWRPDRYAAIAEYATRSFGMRVILVGGRTALERKVADAIRAVVRVPIVDQVGKDTLPQLLALLARADALLSPDSGPVHMATAVATPVLGLYAATNPQRSGPYFSRQYCVDRYDEAARRFLGRPAAELPWTTKIERAGVMDLIEVTDVRTKLDALVRQPLKRARVP